MAYINPSYRPAGDRRCGTCDHSRPARSNPAILVCKHPHRGDIPGCRWSTPITVNSGTLCPLWKQQLERRSA